MLFSRSFSRNGSLINTRRGGNFSSPLDGTWAQQREIGQRNEIFLITRETNPKTKEIRSVEEKWGWLVKNGGDHCVKKESKVGKIVGPAKKKLRFILLRSDYRLVVTYRLLWCKNNEGFLPGCEFRDFITLLLSPFSGVKNMDTKNYVSCGETARLIFQTVPSPPPPLCLSFSFSLSLGEYQISRNGWCAIRVGSDGD